MIRDIKRHLRTVGLAGLMCAIKAHITKTTTFFKVKRSDCKHPIVLRIPSSDIPTYQQVFINNEYSFQTERQPKIIIDAGANIGLASIYFANKFPEARIFALEPEKSNFELLRRNVEPYANITPLHAALWDKCEEINLVDPGLGKWGFMTESGNQQDKSNTNVCHSVTATTIDKIMADHNLQRIDILKIDIEGAEKEVFGDTSKWIDKVESIIIELHERMKAGCNRSFYCGSPGFALEWQQGENVYLSKGLLRRTDGA